MWDPRTYLQYNDQRSRPVHDLLARVGATNVRRAVDLGCGVGNLTPLLSHRWPDALVEAIDSSPEMISAARANGVDARQQDVRDWQPEPDTDVVLCNAVLQWVPEHVDLLLRWLPALPAGSWFAFQVPGNFLAPSHQAIRQLAEHPAWRAVREVLPGNPVLPTVGYADVLADLGMDVDVWETTYLHRLHGENPVLDWLTATTLRPVRAVLDDEAWNRFLAELGPLLLAAYPPRADGTTWLPFRRLFAVAHWPGGA